MHAFDSLIERLNNLPGNPSQVFQAVDASDIPFEFGPHTGRGVVLQRDTALELGNDGLSYGMVLATSAVGRVADGRIRIYGKDAQELLDGEAPRPVQAPFGQIIIAAGSGIASETFPDLEDCQHVKDYVKGYFVRSSAGQIHSRVSSKLAEAGFGFKELGSLLIRMVKEACPDAERVEVIFVTEAGEAFESLKSAKKDWLDLAHDVRKGLWLEKGIDIDCPAGGHCGQCADKELCNNVRKIARMRKEGQ